MHPGNLFPRVSGDHFKIVVPPEERSGAVIKIENARKSVQQRIGKIFLVHDLLMIPALLGNIPDDLRKSFMIARFVKHGGNDHMGGKFGPVFAHAHSFLFTRTGAQCLP